LVKKILVRPLLGLLAAILLGLLSATSGAAYGGGPANWQVAFAGTAVAPGTGFGFGFWGWCAFSGGVTSGNSADCQVTQYQHAPKGSGLPSVNCHQSINVTSWDATGGTFVISGTAVTTPASAAALCGAAGGVPPSFSGFNTGIPAAPGHYSMSASSFFPGAVGEFQAQVTEIP
jgi:hypothetical protein